MKKHKNDAKAKKRALRQKRAKIAFASISGMLTVGCVVCGLIFRENISSIPFWVGAAVGLLGVANALWKVIGRWVLPLVTILCLSIGVAGEMSYATVGGYTYSVFATTLDASNDKITSLDGIERFRFLRRIDISGRGLTDVSPLEALPQLEEVNIRGNIVSEEQYENLCAALPNAKILWSVPLGQNRYDDNTEAITVTENDFVTMEMFRRQLGYFPALKLVDVTGMDMDRDAITGLQEAKPQVRFVWTADVGDSQYPTNAQTVKLTGFDDSGTLLAQLADFPDLTELDIRETECGLSDIRALTDGLEGVTVHWLYKMGGNDITDETETLDLRGCALRDANALEEVLDLSDTITQVDIVGTGLSNDAVYALCDGHEDVTFTYGLDVFGVRVACDDTQVDLTNVYVDDEQALRDALDHLPRMADVQMGNTSISSASLSAIRDEHEGMVMGWNLGLYGFAFRTDTTKISFGGKSIASLAALEAALEYMPNVKYIDLSYCGQPDATIARFRDEHPDINVVWVVNLGRWTLRTDATAFSTLDGTRNKLRETSQDFAALRYCTKLKALDLGHQQITDISFLEYMPELRILILADNRISDLTPIGTLKHLQYCELFMNQIRDLSPLANCTELLDLNLCYNYVGDVSPLFGLSNLERLWFSGNGLAYTKMDSLSNALQGCKCDFKVDSSTGDGWREHPRYDTLYRIFNDTKEWEDWE